MKFTKRSIDDIKAIPIERLFPDAVNLGNRYICRCPGCGDEYNSKKKKGGFTISIEKNSGYCFKCKFGLSGPINAYAYLNNLDQKRDFPKIIKELAEINGITLEEESLVRMPEFDGRPIAGSFAWKQLQESGLTPKDITAEVIEGDRLVKIPVFQKGALNVSTGAVDPTADEMVILYYDLEGRRKTYQPLGTRSIAKERPYTRVRWSNPDAHPDKSGDPIKYQTPYGAKSFIYIPQKIREMYKNGTQFDTLIIQEGEKKAEKACKHGLWSIGIAGINNIGKKDEGLPPDIQYLTQRCGIKNIVLLFDSDWNNLSRNLKEDGDVDLRPKQFARAAIKFRKFVRTLYQLNIHVDMWFGHINENEKQAKGVDDLLCKVLEGKESELSIDVENSLISLKGEGKYVSLYNISTLSDTQILDFWKLNSKNDFFEIHRDRLLQLKSFRFDKVYYNVIDGAIKQASEYGKGSEFWEVDYDPENGKKKIKMSIIDAKSFLEANGFRSHVDEEGNNLTVRIDRGVICNLKIPDVHRYVFNYVSKAANDRDILEYFAEVLDKKLSQSKLNLLDPLETRAGIPEQHIQRFYYRNAQIAITDSDIKTEPLRGPVWQDNLVNRDFLRVKIFEDIRKNPDGSFSIQLTEDGKDCEFLTYLINASTFNDIDNPSQEFNNAHLINKITCIGYLLRSYKSYIETKVVVAMDGRMSEVGDSNGRSGKSIVGLAIKNMVKQTMIGGRNIKDSDEFILTEVKKTTDNVFIDDIKINFNFGALYTAITGDMSVNVKGGNRFTIPFEYAPKIFMTTNHAIKSEGDSTEDRTVFMAFSSHYNINNTPAMEFGHQFFSEWDERQWTLFDNLMIECVYYYMKSIQLAWTKAECGAIPPPMDMLNLRRFRQSMGEAFYQWADAYFSPDGENINSRIPRKDLFNIFHKETPGQLSYVSATGFRRKILAFCEYNRYHLNPHKKHKTTGQTFDEWIKEHEGQTFEGAEDKSGGVEYITVGDNNFNGATNDKLHY